MLTNLGVVYDIKSGIPYGYADVRFYYARPDAEWEAMGGVSSALCVVPVVATATGPALVLRPEQAGFARDVIHLVVTDCGRLQAACG